GNSNSATAIVTVEDNINPTAVTQDIVVALDASGNASILASQIDNGSTDNCSITSMDIYISDFTCADLGDNTVELTVTDQSGNSNSATAVVTVEDNINPTAVTQDIVVALDASGNASILASQIDNGSTDNCSVVSLDIDISDFTCADLGDNTVELTVTDQSGNSGSATATVTVVDLIDPVINCSDGFEVESEGGYTLPDYVLEGDVTASDNCGFSVVQTPLPGTVLPNGDYIIEFDVTDDAGNTVNCFFELKVVDTTLSIDDLELSNNAILLFPNPVRDTFTIKNKSRLNLRNAEIYDVSGRTIKILDLRNMAVEEEVSFANYAQGIYLVKIYAENNSSLIKRFVKK
ncbi:T9SS type A sorting domain-containing protein, partial [Winogradskyella sp.]